MPASAAGPWFCASAGWLPPTSKASKPTLVITVEDNALEDNLAAAIADFSASIDIDPNYAPAYFQRGKVYERLGDRTGAISNYHQAAKLYLDRGDSKTYQQLLQILDRLVGRS